MDVFFLGFGLPPAEMVRVAAEVDGVSRGRAAAAGQPAQLLVRAQVRPAPGLATQHRGFGQLPPRHQHARRPGALLAAAFHR